MARLRAVPALPTVVGSVSLRHPMLAASGTAGHTDELAGYVHLASIGGVVTKSLASFEWAGNKPPRLHPTNGGMINAVGLQGPGVAAWRRDDLPGLVQRGATVIASIWGRTLDEYRAAAEALAGVSAEVVAVEVNLSCPNLSGHGMFAQSPADAAAAIEATAACGLPRWAKLTAAVTDLVSVARAVADAGAEAVTLINTIPGMVIDVESRRPVLSNRSGGVSGPAIHPMAVKAVYDVHAALPDLPIVGVGGVMTGTDAIELIMAGASAVEVGTASFLDPSAVGHIAHEVSDWCHTRGVTNLSALVGAGHDR
jgi:dihydroorotate dehydrogenase (NAD+) catalytic subunit